VARLIDDSTGARVELAHFTGNGSPRRDTAFDPAPLRASLIPEPDLKSAIRLSFTFDASDMGQFTSASLDDALGSMRAPGHARDPAARVDRNPRCPQRIDQDRELIIVRATGG
jgi:hypothetical protein